MKDTFRVRIQEELPWRKHVNTSSLAPQRRLVVCQKSFILLPHQTGTPSLSHMPQASASLQSAVEYFLPECSPAGTPGPSSRSSACRSGPERPAGPGSAGRCGSFGGPFAAAASPAVETTTMRCWEACTHQAMLQTPCLYGLEKRYKNILTSPPKDSLHLLLCAIYFLLKNNNVCIFLFFSFSMWKPRGSSKFRYACRTTVKHLEFWTGGGSELKLFGPKLWANC